MPYVLKVVTEYRGDHTGRDVLLPALLTQDGILLSHIRYLADIKFIHRSSSWRERSVFALKLLIKFINSNGREITKVTDLLSAFALALEIGTINVSTQTDPSCLYWSPRKIDDAKTLLGHITSYTDWLAEQADYMAVRANPFREATYVEQQLNWCAYYQKESNIFLRHLRNSDDAASSNSRTRSVKTSNPSKSTRPATKRFPESEIQNLLQNGWVRRNGSPDATEHDFIDYKGRAINILMHYGGLRKSEVFHMFLIDLIPDKKKNDVIVRIYHPSNGRLPDDIVGYTNRMDYLSRRYRMLPRNKYIKSHSLHSGWKEPLLSEGADGYIEVHFFPMKMSKEFLYNYMMYLKHQRVDPLPGADHPYAFTNTQGSPETVKNFNRQHRDAVNRIGLVHAKRLGTTEHGHRHAYGQRLTNAGLNEVVIQKAMHHKSLESQEVYTGPSDEDVRRELRRSERSEG